MDVSPASSSPPATRVLPEHIPALDGLRGIAILMVMLLHFGSAEVDDVLGSGGLVERLWVKVAHQGGAGVDLFFVLSGFLITRILLKGRGGPYFLRNFYIRRVLRIFPLYYGTLLLLFALYIPFLAAPHPILERYRDQQAWLWLYLPNVATSFFGVIWKGGPVNIDHLWSLAVEEHFYLLWPWLVLVLSRRGLLRVCSAILVLAVVAKLAFLRAGLIDAAYQLTISRLDGLALGAGVAVLAAPTGGVTGLRRPAWVAFVGGALGIGVLASLEKHPSFWWTTALTHTLYSVFFAGALVLVLDAREGGPLARLLASGFLRLFGRLSYGLYMFHVLLRPTLLKVLPIARFEAILGSRLAGVFAFFAIATAICCLIASASWLLYEKPMIGLKRWLETVRAVPDHPRPAQGAGS